MDNLMQVPVPMAVFDEHCHMVLANDSYRECFVVDADPSEMHFRENSVQEGLVGNIAEVLRDGQNRCIERVFFDTGNQQRDYQVSLSLFDNKSSTRKEFFVLAVFTEVTELKQLQGRLDEARLFRRALIASSHDAIVATNEAGKIVIFNKAAEALFKRDAFEVLGFCILRDLLDKGIVQAITTNSKEVFIQETTLQVTDGESIPVSISSSRIKRGEGPPGIAIFISDLRRLKKLERENINAAKMAAIGQTVAGVSHSIKNILNGLEGGMYVYQSGRRNDSEERIEEGWQMITQNITRISDLIKSFLLLAKEKRPADEIIAPKDIITEIYNLYRKTALQAGIDFAMEPMEEELFILGDSSGLHTCLCNLVCNALDACAASESVEKSISMKCMSSSNDITITVSDNGVGLNDETKKRIFRNFYTTKGSRGTGLGLLISQKIVHDHKGRIEVESEQGRGAVFKMTFPRHHLA